MADQRLGLAQQQIERMDVAAAAVLQGGAVGIRADHARHVLAGHQFDVGFGRDPLEFLLPCPQRVLLARVEGEIAVVVAEIGVDAVARDALLDDARAEIGDLEQGLEARSADVLLHRLDIVTNAGHYLATVAPGAAIAEMTRLQHDDIADALLGELERGVDAGKAAADHHHVGIEILHQPGKREVVFPGRRVVVERIQLPHVPVHGGSPLPAARRAIPPTAAARRTGNLGQSDEVRRNIPDIRRQFLDISRHRPR